MQRRIHVVHILFMVHIHVHSTSMCVCALYVEFLALSFYCSEEKIAQMSVELEEERERMSSSMVSSTGEASNLSFEMSEADL